MKLTRNIRIAIGTLTLACASFGYALETNTGQRSVIVSFENSKQFTDIDADNKKRESRILEEVASDFKKYASKYLKDGYTLDVIVRDIDLAGDRSPMTSQYGDIRVMADIYTPRIEFTYRVINANEQVVLEKESSLSNINYVNTLRVTARDLDSPAPFISQLIRDWSGDELRRALANNE